MQDTYIHCVGGAGRTLAATVTCDEPFLVVGCSINDSNMPGTGFQPVFATSPETADTPSTAPGVVNGGIAGLPYRRSLLLGGSSVTFIAAQPFFVVYILTYSENPPGAKAVAVDY